MKTCPECGEEMELFDFGTARIYKFNVEWEHYVCSCGYEESNEPDYEED